MADAATSAACGLLMVLAAGPLATMLGLPEMLLRGAGGALLPFSGALAYMSLRPKLPRIAVGAVVLVNGLWAADSVLLLMSGWVAPTLAGTVFILAQAGAVGLYAALQSVGLRNSPLGQSPA
jgi:hypothetical protein